MKKKRILLCERCRWESGRAIGARDPAAASCVVVMATSRGSIKTCAPASETKERVFAPESLPVFFVRSRLVTGGARDSVVSATRRRDDEAEEPECHSRPVLSQAQEKMKRKMKKGKTKTKNRLRYLASLGRTSANRLAALYESLPALCIHALCKADWPLRAARSRRDYFAGVARALAVRHLTPHAASSIISGRPLDGLLLSALVSNQFNAFPRALFVPTLAFCL